MAKRKQITSKASKRPLTRTESARAWRALIRNTGSGPRAQSEARAEFSRILRLSPAEARKAIRTLL